MTDITPESLRALAGLLEAKFPNDRFVLDPSLLLHTAHDLVRAAADEIERLKRPSITIQGAAEMLEDGTLRRGPSHD